MRNQEVNIYKEIQRTTERAMKAIDTVSEKVYDENLALQISKQSLKFAEIRNEAYDRILEAKAEPHRSSYFKDFRISGAIQYNTLLNTSTSKIAELMIRESNTGVLEMNKVLNHNEDADNRSVELAHRLIELEEKNIETLKKYL